MKKQTCKLLKSVLCGVPIGIVNGLFGAGGGMLAVPLLKSAGLDQKEAHANAVAVILPITALSAAIYLFKGYVRLSAAAVYIPTGLIGALMGTLLLKKLSGTLLRRIFGAFMIYSGIRMLLK